MWSRNVSIRIVSIYDANMLFIHVVVEAVMIAARFSLEKMRWHRIIMIFWVVNRRIGKGYEYSHCNITGMGSYVTAQSLLGDDFSPSASTRTGTRTQHISELVKLSW
uniref:Uncharacterized protein n=1 Tax=Pseudo-nitzschia australis TaxID=44445 RepID=A0A7S4ERI6_9STRA|mmetsp:Transcript_8522/g.16803  ORF Transcript_8522/g.16803 Transcript_8522/m.16803 type:complete len:107 (+) Transcript_8522:260-580(+)